MSEPEAPATAATAATADSQNVRHEVVAAAVVAVLCCFCVTGSWACCSYNERAAAEARAKSEAVQAMVNAGRPQQEINQLLIHWNPPPTAGQSPGDKRAELVRSLQQRNAPPAEIIKIVSLCFPEDAERAKADAERPKPTADEKAKPDAERSKTADVRAKARSETPPQ